MALIDKAKVALRLTTDAYDEEITDLIEAAQADLDLVGVVQTETPDAITQRAILTYVRAHFGSPEDYERLKASYDEQKAQLMNATGHTEWGDEA